VGKQKPENYRTMLLQIGTEFWKAQSDFFKHLMTSYLAAVAVFGALLGGFYNAFDLNSAVNVGLIVGTFLAFLASLTLSAMAAHDARGNIVRMLRVETEYDLEAMREKRKLHRIRAMQGFTTGVIALALFIMFNAI
jgi:hypothetical protein